MKDTLTALIGYLFSEDKKEHPMPQNAAGALMEKVKNLLKKERRNHNG